MMCSEESITRALSSVSRVNGFLKAMIPDSDKPNSATTKSHRGMDQSFLETASSWSIIAVVVLSVLAAVAGISALFFSTRLSTQKATTAEKELNELKEWLNPRRIVGDRPTSFVKRLNASPAKGLVFLVTESGDPEVKDFADDILRALKAAGWPVESRSSDGRGGRAAGLMILRRDSTNVPTHLAPLVQAFTDEGIVPQIGKDQAVEAGSVTIV